MSEVEFDPTPYLHAPIVDAPSALALAQALHSSSMKGATPEVKRAETKMMKARDALQSAWTAFAAASPGADKRPADVRLDNAWSALQRRIEAYSWLPHESHPQAKVAEEILGKLFPEGLSFLTLAYATEWAESERRLETITREKLEKRIDAIAGAEFLEELRTAHAAYGEVLGITKAAKHAPAVNVAEPLAALRRAIAQYTLKVAALAEDADSIERVRASLAPVDAQREAATRRGATAAVVPGGPAPSPDGSPAAPAKPAG